MHAQHLFLWSLYWERSILLFKLLSNVLGLDRWLISKALLKLGDCDGLVFLGLVLVKRKEVGATLRHLWSFVNGKLWPL
jgi:hypothetical protein